MARTKGPKKTKRYSDDFKIRAVQLADHADILAKDAVKDLGVHPKESWPGLRQKIERVRCPNGP